MGAFLAHAGLLPDVSVSRLAIRLVPHGSTRLPASLRTTAPLAVGPGDTVGVVLLCAGGPTAAAEVEPYLYSRYLATDAGWLPRRVRSVVCRVRARRDARALREAYELVGGTGRLARHTAEQAESLAETLQHRFGKTTGASFRTYTVQRHWQPANAETIAAMVADGVTHVVLLPLHPHFSAAGTGASFACWNQLSADGARPQWPTARVSEYAVHPKYVQALAERVDEGLQRFPREIRGRVQVVFAAQSQTPDGADGAAPYCCLVHATAQAVVGARAGHDPDRRVHVAFGRPTGRGRGLPPEVRDTIRQIAYEGEDAVLVVPVSFVSDRLETAYELDVRVREAAAELGVVHFEVTQGLNGHPLFVDALADCVASQLAPFAATAAPSAGPSRNGHPVLCGTCGREAAPSVWPQAAPAYREAA